MAAAASHLGEAAAGRPQRGVRRRLLALVLLGVGGAAAALQAAGAFAGPSAWGGGARPAARRGRAVAPAARGLEAAPAAARRAQHPAAERRSAVARRAEQAEAALAKVATGAGQRLLVLGGNGFVGREVCRLAVSRGYTVTSLSRRGENPEPNSKELSAVKWVQGDAADAATVSALVGESDAVVHAVGLLFDANSGLTKLNLVVSGSKSVPTAESTYDRTTRQTAFNVIEALRSQFRLPWSPPTPVLFVSAAEAGWPEVSLGPEVENIAPEWLKRYLVAKRAVEAEIQTAPGAIRPVIFRPSLIWSWTKFDVLPIIPVFNFLNWIGVPFVDKTVTVNTLSKAIIAGLEDPGLSGVQRFQQMEVLEQQVA